MAKTHAQLEKECNALIKLVLLEMEILASLPPEEASEPYSFQDRRQRVVRKIWTLFKDSVNHERSELGEQPHGDSRPVLGK